MGSFCAMAHPSVMYRRDDVLKVGGYNPMTRHYEDYDLWVRMAEQGFRFANLSDVLERLAWTPVESPQDSGRIDEYGVLRWRRVPAGRDI